METALLCTRRITSLLLGLHLDAGVCDSANLQRSTWADIARFVSPGFPIQPPRSNSHRIKLCPCRHLDAHLASNRCISGGGGADMSYGNFNRATLLIYRGSSMKANYLDSWRRTEISAGMEITRGPDRYLTSNLCIDSHVSEVSPRRLIEPIESFQWGDKKSDATILNPFQIQACGLPRANFQWLTWGRKEVKVNLPLFCAIKGVDPTFGSTHALFYPLNAQRWELKIRIRKHHHPQCSKGEDPGGYWGVTWHEDSSVFIEESSYYPLCYSQHSWSTVWLWSPDYVMQTPALKNNGGDTIQPSVNTVSMEHNRATNYNNDHSWHSFAPRCPVRDVSEMMSHTTTR